MFIASSGHGDPLRRWMLLVLPVVWGARLAWHTGRRSIGKPEDPRYQALLDKQPGNADLYALRMIYELQGLLALLIAAPILVGGFEDRHVGAWAWVGIAVWGLGLFFEAVGDLQMERFRANPADKGKVIDAGDLSLFPARESTDSMQEAAMPAARTKAKESTSEMLTVLEAADILGVGRTMAYALIHADEWPTPVVRVGRLIKIPAEPLRQLVATGSAPHPDAGLIDRAAWPTSKQESGSSHQPDESRSLVRRRHPVQTLYRCLRSRFRRVSNAVLDTAGKCV